MPAQNRFTPLTAPYGVGADYAVKGNSSVTKAHRAVRELLSCVWEFLSGLWDGNHEQAASSPDAAAWYSRWIHAHVTRLLDLAPRCERLVTPLCKQFAAAGQPTRIDPVQEISVHAAVVSLGQYVLRDIYVLLEPQRKWNRSSLPTPNASAYQDSWLTILNHFESMPPFSLSNVSNALYSEFVKVSASSRGAIARKVSQPTALKIRGKLVFVRGMRTPLDLTPERTDEALAFLGRLCSEPGNWMSGPDIAKATNRESTRFDLVYKALPAGIKSLIESNRRKGYRLRK